MRKRRMSGILAVVLLAVLLLAGCGSSADGGAAKNVDWTAFYQQAAADYGWTDSRMLDLNDAGMLESFYPGLSETAMVQCVAKVDRMSAVVNEVVFLECGDEAGAGEAEGILQQRITTQSEGGAWYPEAMESWENATVIRKGVHVALIACQSKQEDLTARVRELLG